MQAMREQLADTEKERDDFCAMVVDLETKLMESEGPQNLCVPADEGLERQIGELERRKKMLNADRAELETKCAELRQQSEQQRRDANELEAAHRQLQRDYADLSEQNGEEAEQAKTLLSDDKASLLALKDDELDQLQEEFARALTESEANADALRTSERINTQLRQDLDKMRGDVEQLLALETERQEMAAIEEDGKMKLQKQVELQTERAAQAEAAVSTAEQRAHALEKRVLELVGEQDTAAHRTIVWEENGHEVQQRVLQLTSDNETSQELLSQKREQCEKTRVDLDDKHAQNTRLQLQIVDFEKKEKEAIAQLYRLCQENTQLLTMIRIAEESEQAVAAAAAAAAVAAAAAAAERVAAEEEACCVKEALIKETAERMGVLQLSHDREKALAECLRATSQGQKERLACVEGSLAQTERDKQLLEERLAENECAATQELSARLEVVEEKRARACMDMETLRLQLQEAQVEAVADKMNNATIVEEKERLGEEVSRLGSVEKDLSRMRLEVSRLGGVEEELSRIRLEVESFKITEMNRQQLKCCVTPGLATPRTPAINLTTPSKDAPKSEGRWLELRNIQSGDKWYKVPDVAAYSEATKKAQLALRAAEDELRHSTEKSNSKSVKYREPWTPPSLPWSLSGVAGGQGGQLPQSAAKSARKDVFQTNLAALLEDAADPKYSQGSLQI